MCEFPFFSEQPQRFLCEHSLRKRLALSGAHWVPNGDAMQRPMSDAHQSPSSRIGTLGTLTVLTHRCPVCSVLPLVLPFHDQACAVQRVVVVVHVLVDVPVLEDRQM